LRWWRAYVEDMTFLLARLETHAGGGTPSGDVPFTSRDIRGGLTL
jgi:hypothetical protein